MSMSRMENPVQSLTSREQQRLRRSPTYRPVLLLRGVRGCARKVENVVRDACGHSWRDPQGLYVKSIIKHVYDVNRKALDGITFL
jgi:hypothetical protein